MIPSIEVIDIIASSGFDFIILDQEHGPINFETIQNQISICENNNCSPIVRVPGVLNSDILRSLDIGAHGLQIPNVKNIEDIEKIIEYSKYPPIGNRGFSTFTRAGGYNIENAKNLFNKANDNTMIGINIESFGVFDQIINSKIVDFVDIFFFGTYDLSKELNKPGELNNPKIDKLLIEGTKKINSIGKVSGTIATNYEMLEKYLSFGMKYILYKVDCGIIKKSFLDIKKCFDKNNES